MPGVLSGTVIVIGIMLVAGVIAYIGDRVGHQVGRKRLTLFGLRPKYTSTIVAVATGMLIALCVTLVALIASNLVRTAFFRLGQLNAQINQLQAQALAQQKELDTTRTKAIVLARGQLIAPYGRDIDLNKPEAEQMREFSALFAETVRYANQTYTGRVGLLPYKRSISDPQVRQGMLQELHDARQQQIASGNESSPVFFLPVAFSNLFHGETISFGFPHWADKRLFADGETVASIVVEGGKPLALPDYTRLINGAVNQLATRGFPAPFIGSPLSGIDPVKLQQISAQLATVRGRYRIVARSVGDLYPHSGQFVLSTSLEPVRT